MAANYTQVFYINTQSTELRSMIDEARKWLRSCHKCPTLREFRRFFGWDKGSKILDELLDAGEVLITDDRTILIT